MDRVPVITLLTDFGCDDWFVGAMKAVFCRLAPRARVVDLTHGVPPHAVTSGAFVLHCNYSLYPPGTIHVAVVDPGVGTARRGVAVAAAGYWFVGPDNGLIDGALRGGDPARARPPTKPHTPHAAPRVFELSGGSAGWKPQEGAPRRSATFHGRDLFAAAAARLASGADGGELGTPGGPLLPGGDWWRPADGGLAASVLWVDRFGNLITGVPRAVLGALAGPPGELRIDAGGLAVTGLSATFGDVPVNMPVAYVGSCGTLEVAVREGHAARLAGLRVGDTLFIRRRKRRQPGEST